MNQAQQLVQMLDPLRDPAAIGWWPLAPGWWLVIALVAALITWLVILAIRYYRRGAPIREAKRELDRIRTEHASVNATLTAINALQRRLAISLSGRRSCAQLTGAQWSDFLNALSRDQGEYFSASLLGVAYQPTASDGDVEALLAATSEWLNSLRVQR
ncbi:MAG: DUF4381 domain-containing protein [Congregibacter sp.]